ncbi:MAG: FKBP-type peptidyl-prolyl cis-trans isomerase [Thermoplasmata archaeon]|nr:MAG: FKBP-type peptidyl-prolyl cis-trans isomerase [Thermoplasmata archaeon]
MDMAKRRSEIGKTGKHKRDEISYETVELAERSHKRRNVLVIVLFIAVIAVVAVFMVFYFDILGEDTEDKIEVLDTDNPSKGGLPTEDITYEFTITNPEKEADIFSILVLGLPSDWNITVPSTISLEGEESAEKQFTISPSTATALNKTHTFWLNVTSGSSQVTYSLEYKLTVFHAFYGIEVFAYNNSHDADPGNSTSYGIFIKNDGNGNDNITFSFVETHLPVDWSVSFESDYLIVPAYSTRAFIVTITTSSNTSKGRYDILIIATSSGGQQASIWLNTSLVMDFEEKTLAIGDLAMVDYIGYFIDGLIFDTSIEEVATNANFSREPNVQSKTTFAPLGMVVGSEDPTSGDEYIVMILGFWEAAVGMKANETKVVRLPPEKAYPDGLWRIFEIRIVSIDS